MSGYRPGQEQGHDPYIDYAAHPEAHPEERVFVPHVQDIQHGAAQGLTPLHEQHHIGAHHQPQQQHHHQQQQQQHPQHQVFEHPMAHHHQSPQFGGGQMMYGAPRQMQQPTGTKRSRPDDLELGMEDMPGPSMQPGDMQSMPPQMPPQMGYGGQPVQTYHSHPLPNQGHRSKMPRMSEGDSSMIEGPSGGAPSVVGMEGMPAPAARPRGPKLKFTPEDDQLLVDLKENKSLTWKQIAEFFPGRSSGTLQVRYCTKLKAKTTQWTEETVNYASLAMVDGANIFPRSKNFGRRSMTTSRRSGALWHKR
jgi:hypothetical protein